ncbi:MAG: site-specific integrase [Thermomicrobiaceae bacterium]
MVNDKGAANSGDAIYQPPLFESGGRARLLGHAGQINDLTPHSSLDIARYWFRRYLEQSGYPRNTVDSYSYDLSILNSLIGSKRIDRINSRDIAQYLDASLNRSTRKRRLTSVSRFFRYLITSAQVLDHDPAQTFHPDPIPLKTPKPLFASEQVRLLEAAEQDGPRAHAIIWLFLNLGLTRAELLRLKHSDVDLEEPGGAVVYIFYDSPRHAGKERKLAAGTEFTTIYQSLVDEYGREGTLFEMLPQSVNRLIERVSAAAEIRKTVSPQSLRDTFAVNQARNGLEEQQLLELLGLASDARNRTSVQRYIKLARPPLRPGRAGEADDDPAPGADEQEDEHESAGPA